EDGSAVDREEIALGQHHVGARDAVHHHVVAGGADRAGEAVVAEERRHRARRADGLLRHPVEVQRAHSGPGGLTHRHQRAPDDRTGSGHRIELPRGAERDDPASCESHGYLPSAAIARALISSLSPTASTVTSIDRTWSSTAAVS